ncbi:MAG TPA: hypothetical protein VHV83_15740 [Armatimonadota bacterium]|nr:hypothetical protein [Armatimonadota bacterium]
MHHLATILLRSLEQYESPLSFTGEFLQRWPTAVRQQLTKSRLMQRDGVETQVRCPHCDSACLVDVEWQQRDGGRACPFLNCVHPHGFGMIPLVYEEVERWHFSCQDLVTAIARILDQQAPCDEIIADRLWWLGAHRIEQRDVDIFFARGVHWADAPHLFMQNTRITECVTPLILVPYDIPMTSPFPRTASLRSLASLLRYEDNQIHLRVEQIAGTIRQRTPERQQQVLPIPTHPDTNWLHVIITFANEEYVQIAVGKDQYLRSYAEMGFADLRKPTTPPSELWNHLRLLAKFNGRLGWDTPAVSIKNRQKVSKWISGIRQKLQAVFPDIAGDPFEPYKKVKAYQTKCTLRWAHADHART